MERSTALMMQRKLEKDEEQALKDRLQAQARPLSRPSAAAAGFDTAGLTDKQVEAKLRPKAHAKAKAKPKAKSKAKASTKTAEKESSESECDSKPELESSDSSSSSPSLSSSSSGGESEEEKEEKPEMMEDVKSDNEDVQQARYRVREQFPKTNIRRWTTPGPRYERPISSLEAVRAAKEKMKLKDEMNEKHHVKPSAVEPSEPEETSAKKPKKGDMKKKGEVKSKAGSTAEKGKVEAKGKDKEKKGEGKKGKGEASSSGQNIAMPSASVPPRHRHRTKSARFSITDYQVSLIHHIHQNKELTSSIIK